MTAPLRAWRKARASATEGACVEVARGTAAPAVFIRDSKNPAGGHVCVPVRMFETLLAALRA
jgi:hypothetical protein